MCGTLVVSGGIGLYFAYQENKVALASLQREKAGSAAARIEEFVRQIEGQLEFAALPQLGGTDQRLLEFQKVLRVARAVTDIAYVDANGREQLYVSRLAMNVLGSGKDRSPEPAFREAKPGQTWFGPVYFRKDTEPYMSMAVRTRDKGPLTQAEVNLKFIWDVVTRIRVGERGKAYVVDATGHLVAHPDIGLVLRKTNLSQLEQVKRALEPGAADSEAMLAADIGGTNVLTAFAPTEDLGWKVFVEQPVSEVFAALDATILRTVVLLVAGLLFSAFAALWLARSMVRPIATLQEGAARIGAGDLDQSIDVRTGDELESLADEFNRMSAQLRESYAGLENKVEQRTAELQQTLEQQTAIAEILRVISSSPADVQPVLQAVTERAARICEAKHADVMLAEGDQLRVGASVGEGIGRPNPGELLPLNRDTVMGRSIVDRIPVHVADLQTDEEFKLGRQLAHKHGHRTILAVPLVREGTALGTLLLRRPEVRPFEEKHITLLRAFADQAVIAIENVRLFNETKEALEQQTATSDILHVTSKSPTDVKPVFDTILANTLRLCEGSTAVLWIFEGKKLQIGAHLNMTEGAIKHLTENPLEPGDWNPTAQAALERRTVHVLDVFAEPRYRPLVPSGTTNTRPNAGTVLAVPLLRDGELLGVITVWRYEKQLFSEKQLAMVNTFAAQAVIAIENVRLFNETKESLEQQTAISEILRVISSSPSDVQPVLEAVAERAARICDARIVDIIMVEGTTMRMRASIGELGRPLVDMPIERSTVMGRSILDKTLVHVPDLQNAGDEFASGRELARKYGHRTILVVPLLRDDRALGTIMLRRAEVRPFEQKHMALLKTFADQAAIAIENVRLFNEIQDKSRQLEIANKHKSDFLANMSHELRTPLNAIIGFSEVLSERMFGEVNEKQADYLKDIHESGKHLLSLINDILDLSKIEAGRMDLEIAAFDLPSALSNAMTLVRERAQRHGIALGLEVDERLGEFRADERKFKQIVLNLLSNAVKFTPDGGKVDVFARQMDGAVEIAVRDTGIGIAREDHGAVFEEFKQVGRDARRKAEGTGLGLALTKRFVELHGGEISLQSAPGKGSTFTIKLPLNLPTRGL